MRTDSYRERANLALAGPVPVRRFETVCACLSHEIANESHIHTSFGVDKSSQTQPRNLRGADEALTNMVIAAALQLESYAARVLRQR